MSLLGVHRGNFVKFASKLDKPFTNCKERKPLGCMVVSCLTTM